MCTEKYYDYIIAGGGIAGSVLARRLADKYPNASILLVEAGGRPEGHPLLDPPMACLSANNSELDWAYTTTPQKNLGGRQIHQAAGKMLSGGSAINCGFWTRGSAAEYDQWAKVVGDDRWSWKSMLPYFKKSETFVPGEHPYNPADHGTNGPITVVSVTSSHPERKYPLKSTIAALLTSAGYSPNPDGCSGNTNGFFERWESWKGGKRQPASVAYQVASCSNVTIQTNTMVKRVLFDRKKAVGVEATDASGNILIFKSAEVIISAGTFRSAQLLLVSGIGPTDTLQSHSIPIVHENPHVGKNLHDHCMVPLYWKLKVPNLAVGPSTFQGPAYQIGLPGEYLSFHHDPEVAITAKAEGAREEEVQFLANENVCHTELVIDYAAAGLTAAGHAAPIKSDGMTITTLVADMMPTSRGTVTIASNDISTYPVVDSNVYSTNADRTAIRNAVRKVLRMLTATELGNSIIDHELTDYPGHSDEDIDKRVVQLGLPFLHPSGTCSMGTVVDTECRVIGVDGLRVVDASILPVPLCAHYQAVVYAVAEQAADLI